MFPGWLSGSGEYRQLPSAGGCQIHERHHYQRGGTQSELYRGHLCQKYKSLELNLNPWCWQEIVGGNCFSGCLIILIQSRFDTSHCDTNQSQFDTHL